MKYLYRDLRLSLVIITLFVGQILLASDIQTKEAFQQGKGGKDLQVSDLWITIGKTKVFGQVSMPKGEGKKKVAIISHGFNGSFYFGHAYFKTLNDLGYIVYTFDFPCGSNYSRTDKNTMNMSVIDEKNVLKYIVRYFKKRKDVDSKNIVLMGESQGGLVSALVAAELKNKISRLILAYPALCIPDNWNERYPHDTDIPDTTNLWNVRLGKRYFKEVRKLKLYPALTRYQGKVLIIHGAKDPIVPLSYSEEAYKRYKNAQLHVLPTAGHGFNSDECKEANKLIYDFLK